MPEKQELAELILKIRDDARALEELYRRLVREDSQDLFSDALIAARTKYPRNKLLLAWELRLESQITDDIETPAASRWPSALVLGALSGLCFLLLTRTGNPSPIPIPESKLFSFLWAPLTSLFILAFLYVNRPKEGGSGRELTWSGLIIVLVGAVVTYIHYGAINDLAVLNSMHLVLFCLLVIGAGLSFGYKNEERPAQLFAFLSKSFETAVTAGLFLITGIIFIYLCFGILAVLGIKPMERAFTDYLSFWCGFLAIASLAAVYDPSRSLLEQKQNEGISRVLLILCRVLIPMAALVLAAYVFYFIPVNFFMAFKQREVLTVYNATIIGVLVLLIGGLPGDSRELSGRILKWYMIVTGGLIALTLALNLYALAAIISRSVGGGLTPNRVTVLCWNLATIFVLGGTGWKLIINRTGDWITSSKESLAVSFFFAFLIVAIIVFKMNLFF